MGSRLQGLDSDGDPQASQDGSKSSKLDFMRGFKTVGYLLPYSREGAGGGSPAFRLLLPLLAPLLLGVKPKLASSAGFTHLLVTRHLDRGPVGPPANRLASWQGGGCSCPQAPRADGAQDAFGQPGGCSQGAVRSGPRVQGTSGLQEKPPAPRRKAPWPRVLGTRQCTAPGLRVSRPPCASPTGYQVAAHRWGWPHHRDPMPML